MERADEAIAAAMIRVCDRSGRVVGAGFLATPELVVTCAHVVAAAVAGDQRTELVRLEFPLLPRAAGAAALAVEAQVLSVRPALADDSGDTAVLAVRTPLPPGAGPMPLGPHSGRWDDDLRVFGFPAPYDHGLWVAGRLRGRQGAGWRQWESRPGHPRVGAGFSGSPVWSDRLGAVIGMTIAAHRGREATTAYLVPVETLVESHPEIAPAGAEPANPYRGLEPFLEAHADLFYGRAAAVDRLAAAVATRPVVAVVGPSGSGKSSLVQAGLLPRLRQAGTTIVQFRPDLVLRPGTQLATVLVPLLEPELGEVDRLAATATLATRLASPDPEALAVLAGRLAARCGDRGLLIFADQFEEIAASDPEAARELLGLLVGLINAGLPHPREPAPVRAVLTLRSASLDALLTEGTADALEHGSMLLPPMSREQLRAAVTGPVSAVAFEAGLVERVLDEAGTGHGRLPLVEFVLTRLWEQGTGGVLAHADYEWLGGVSGALVSYAEQVYQQRLTPPEQPLARRLFGELARPELGGGFSLRAARVAELDAELHPVLARLAAHRLVVIGRAVDGAETVDVVHQALLQQWDRLRDWLVGDREFRAWREQLRDNVARWEELGHDSGSLLRGNALVTAHHWLASRGDDLTAAQRRFIRTSDSRRLRELRIWRSITAVIGVLVLLAGGFGVAALRTTQEQQRQYAAQASQLLGGEALRQFQAGRYGTALQLALAAWRTDDSTAGAYAALLHQEITMGSVTAIYPDRWSGDLVQWLATPDGRTLATLAQGGGPAELTVWTGALDGAPDPWRAPDADDAVAAALAPDGTRLAAADRYGGVRVWDLSTRSGPVALQSRQDAALPQLEPQGLAFAPDGSSLLYGYRHEVRNGERADWYWVHRLVIWDVASGQPVHEQADRSAGFSLSEFDDVDQFAFGPDADTVVVVRTNSGGEGSVSVQEAATGRERHRVAGTSTLVRHGSGAVICAPDDDSGPGDVHVVDIGDGTTGPAIARSRCSEKLEVDATGRYLVGEPVQQVRQDPYQYELRVLVDLEAGQRYQVYLPAKADGQSIPAEHLLVSRGGDGALRVLAGVGTAMLALRAVVAPVPPADATVSADGRYQIEIDPDSLRLVDRFTGRIVARHPVPHPLTGQVTSGFVVTADEGYLTTGATGGEVRQVPVFTLPELDRQPPLTVPGHPARLFNSGGTVAFDPCGHTHGFLPRFATQASELTVVCGSVLSRWDVASGEQLGRPLEFDVRHLGDPEDPARSVFPRPGHPEQVFVVTGSGTVELWEVAGRELLASVNTGFIHRSALGPLLAVDTTGSRLAVTGFGGTGITVWEVASREQLYQPLRTGSPVESVVGFGPAGTETLLLDLGDRGGALGGPGGAMLQVWHLPTGELLASPVLPEALVGLAPEGGRYFLRDGRLATRDPALAPLELVLDPGRWFRRLCGIVDRDFTDQERSLLPRGAETDPPCAGRAG